jgi:hypothetical protein
VERRELNRNGESIMSYTVSFEFGLHQHVRIKAVKVEGFVDALDASDKGITHRVVYWMNGSRCETWMYGHELEEM